MTEQSTMILDMAVADAATYADEIGGEFKRLFTEGLYWIRREQEENPGVQWTPTRGLCGMEPGATHVVSPIIVRPGLWVRMIPNEKGYY